MSDMLKREKDKQDQETGTTVGQFMARRGVLTMKEFRDFDVIDCAYGEKVKFTTLILTVVNSRQGEATYGVRIERINEDNETVTTSHLDFDEIDEVVNALSFIDSVAARMREEVRDYTEFSYSTKDDITFGFYQSKGKQTAYFDVSEYGGSVFLDVPDLRLVKQTLEQTAEYLSSRGAQV